MERNAVWAAPARRARGVRAIAASVALALGVSLAPSAQAGYFDDQLARTLPEGAPGYRLVWDECPALHSPSEILNTLNHVRSGDAAAVRAAGCAAAAELRCVVAGGLEEAIPGLHFVRTPNGELRLATAAHVLTFNYLRLRNQGDFAFERNCTITMGDGVPLPGVFLSEPRFADPALDAETMGRGTLAFWTSDAHVDLAYFTLGFDAASESRSLIGAVALRTFAGDSAALEPFAQGAVCVFGTGFAGGYDNRVRIARCLDSGGVETRAATDPGACRFRAPTTVYFSGGTLMGLDARGPVALCVVSSEPGAEPSAPIEGGAPHVSRERARRYTPERANYGVLYPTH